MCLDDVRADAKSGEFAYEPPATPGTIKVALGRQGGDACFQKGFNGGNNGQIQRALFGWI